MTLNKFSSDFLSSPSFLLVIRESFQNLLNSISPFWSGNEDVISKSTSKLSIIIMFREGKNKLHLKPRRISQYLNHLSFLINPSMNREFFPMKALCVSDFPSGFGWSRKDIFLPSMKQYSPRWKLKPSKPARNFIFMEIFSCQEFSSFRHHLVLFWSSFYWTVVGRSSPAGSSLKI